MDENLSFTCQDGTIISYAQYGDLESHSFILYFHGYPASRFEARLLDQPAKQAKLKILAFDRPGFGASSRQNGYLPESTAIHLQEMLTALSVVRITIITISGGTLYGLHFASRFPSMVSRIVIGSGMGEVFLPLPKDMTVINRVFLALGQKWPSIGKGLVTQSARLWRSSPKLAASWLRAGVTKPDREVLNQPHIGKHLERCLFEGIRSSADAVSSEYLALSNPWRWSPERIHCPVVATHGDDDSYVPVDLIQRSLSHVSTAQIEMIKGAGHFWPYQFPDKLLSYLHN